MRPVEKPLEKKEEKKWYEKISLRGYTQVRYNRPPSLVVNDDLINAQGDRSIGKNGGFLIRRARLILFGDVHGIYLQPDMGSSAGTQGGVGVLRDSTGRRSSASAFEGSVRLREHAVEPEHRGEWCHVTRVQLQFNY